MKISEAQLRTLKLLHKTAARRVYRSKRPDDYSWIHDDAHVPLTATLHKLFCSGHATICDSDRDMAVLTRKGRALVVMRGS